MDGLSDGVGFSVAEARRRLPQLLKDVERGGEVRITRRGHPVAVLVSVEEYERLRRRRPSVRAALERFQRRARGLPSEDVGLDTTRDPAPGREVDL